MPGPVPRGVKISEARLLPCAHTRLVLPVSHLLLLMLAQPPATPRPLQRAFTCRVLSVPVNSLPFLSLYLTRTVSRKG